ncbi:Codeine O-demethylase [Acorus calamus]|uniref:Codeine O-demethylase n=1 Tax=Acorus calamus TaxID=4465 RepID=A0AAV9E0R7_ACOCL|nr:Codeine O-demethylase [Acorus calamus]
MDRPTLEVNEATVPTINISNLNQSPHARSLVIKHIGKACREHGFFQVTNHGIDRSIINGAIDAASRFFDLPAKQLQTYKSNDVCEPVRYGTSFKHGEYEKIQFWRFFLKHYAHPLHNYVHLWPDNPSDYRDKMGRYAVETRRLALVITEAIMESLGLGPTYLQKKFEEGMQVMVVNCYPPCPQPELVLGLPSHTDYGCVTILLQSCEGLQVEDLKTREWSSVPDLHGSLYVQIGDHLEVLSNGRYKSVVHRATLNADKRRMSIASIHGLGLDEKVECAEELVDEGNPRAYRESSFRDFLEYLKSTGCTGESSFLNTLRIHGS